MATAVGYGTKASNQYSSAIGYQSVASGVQSTAVGSDVETTGDYSLATGNHAAASGDYSAAVGYKSKSTEEYAFAAGNDTLADIPNSVAIGSNSVTDAAVGTSTIQDNAHGRKEYTIGLSPDIANRINSFSSNTNSLRNIIDANQKEARKGIAGSAALAGLHPLDFDPDHKLDIMAGYGHYHNANAAAIGVAYRPNEDIMITVGSTTNGGDDTVYNAGISYKWGAKSDVSRSKIAMARDLADAKREIAKLQADNEQFKAILNSVLGLNIQTDQNKDPKHN